MVLLTPATAVCGSEDRKRDLASVVHNAIRTVFVDAVETRVVALKDGECRTEESPLQAALLRSLNFVRHLALIWVVAFTSRSSACARLATVASCAEIRITTRNTGTEVRSFDESKVTWESRPVQHLVLDCDWIIGVCRERFELAVVAVLLFGSQLRL